MSDLFPPIDPLASIPAPGLAVRRALSLTQPWATLMVHLEKRNETRSWPTNYRGWFGIHAAAGFPRACQAMCEQEPFATALAAHGYTKAKDLPRGQLLGVTRLLNCVPTSSIQLTLPDKERAFGNYEGLRFAWITAGARRLREPMPMKGALSLWQMPVLITAAEVL